MCVIAKPFQVKVIHLTFALELLSFLIIQGFLDRGYLEINRVKYLAKQYLYGQSAAHCAAYPFQNVSEMLSLFPCVINSHDTHCDDSDLVSDAGREPFETVVLRAAVASVQVGCVTWCRPPTA